MSKVRGDVKVGGAKPDVWFEPKIVWEVLTADLSLSPVYTAAQGLVGLPAFGSFDRVDDVSLFRWRTEGYLCDSRVSSECEMTSRRTMRLDLIR